MPSLFSRLRALVGVGTRFLVVGGLSTLIEIAVFNVCLLALDWDPVASKIVASLVALVNAYFGNREWAFRGRRRRTRGNEIVLFLLVNLACTLLGAGIVWFGAEALTWMLGRTPGVLLVNLVNLGSIIIVVLVRFVLYHKLVFRVRDTGAVPTPQQNSQVDQG